MKEGMSHIKVIIIVIWKKNLLYYIMSLYLESRFIIISKNDYVFTIIICTIIIVICILVVFFLFNTSFLLYKIYKSPERLLIFLEGWRNSPYSNGYNIFPLHSIKYCFVDVFFYVLKSFKCVFSSSFLQQ